MSVIAEDSSLPSASAGAKVGLTAQKTQLKPVNVAVGDTADKYKLENEALGALKVQYSELSQADLDCAVQSASKNLKSLFKGEKHYFEIAESIKRDMEARTRGCWHVIVGRSYGSFVSYEYRSIASFSWGPVTVLCFKHG